MARRIYLVLSCEGIVVREMSLLTRQTPRRDMYGIRFVSRVHIERQIVDILRFFSWVYPQVDQEAAVRADMQLHRLDAYQSSNYIPVVQTLTSITFIPEGKTIRMYLLADFQRCAWTLGLLQLDGVTWHGTDGNPVNSVDWWQVCPVDLHIAWVNARVMWEFRPLYHTADIIHLQSDRCHDVTRRSMQWGGLSPDSFSGRTLERLNDLLDAGPSDNDSDCWVWTVADQTRENVVSLRRTIEKTRPPSST